MINEQCNFVRGVSIQDVWREAMWLCVKNGYDFVVKGGSYKGQIRKQLKWVKMVIDKPGLRPLAPIMPVGLPVPTDEGKIEQYFVKYLMNDEVEEHEQYTYGTYIKAQIGRAIELLQESKGNTNQACISVGDRSSIYLSDPPCLRTIDFKVVNGRLNMNVFFRSWDLFAGLPENLGGLQLVKEYVLEHLKEIIDIEDGEIIADSDGLHIYEQYFDIVDELNVDKINVSPHARKDKESFSRFID